MKAFVADVYNSKYEVVEKLDKERRENDLSNIKPG
ncbi:hypothetical protein G51EAM_00462 [Candidatus Nanoperiomorbus periodonticus]|jgi:hypothetical protein|nr:hypothetical protein G51EAM_00462 [Candidatus Nanoperiomorbus periodonticus]